MEVFDAKYSHRLASNYSSLGLFTSEEKARAALQAFGAYRGSYTIYIQKRKVS